ALLRAVNLGAHNKDKQACIVYPDGIGRSRITNALVERKLGSRGTGRNRNTVLKLDALAGE
ncbi:MAG: hypothetical protein H0T50_10075, partial [Gemmatimonadales bacterium]|nr:hypothetical protein [Gemmatimonadales bacterium]